MRREDFPSLELFARVKSFSEDNGDIIKDVALVGLNGDLITNMMRPRF